MDRTVLLVSLRHDSLAHGGGRGFDGTGIGHTRFAYFGHSVVCAACLERPVRALQLVSASVGAGILTTTIKDYIDRARPEVVTPLVEVSGLSYPSGHSLAAASLYLTVAILVCRHLQTTGHQIAILAMTVGIILLVGMTRIYLAVHYPSDVASGIALGAAGRFCWPGAFRFS